MLGSSLILFVGAQLRPPFAGFGGAKFLAGGNDRDAVVDGSPQLLAAGAAGGFDVAEAEAKVGVSFVDGVLPVTLDDSRGVVGDDVVVVS
ncbi:hypothetical protein [Microbacterium schleiferi]|uniref:hypothetical protein n=1 Tax=Microbacterium schleiferi TaxID=69362 RepID=UPI001D171550|nr:hypothetical protein [Microbacterium schleiferi]MCC4268557.1 hypothetical protein [Microbacterium schleiferi]